MATSVDKKIDVALMQEMNQAKEREIEYANIQGDGPNSEKTKKLNGEKELAARKQFAEYMQSLYQHLSLKKAEIERYIEEYQVQKKQLDNTPESALVDGATKQALEKSIADILNNLAKDATNLKSTVNALENFLSALETKKQKVEEKKTILEQQIELQTALLAQLDQALEAEAVDEVAATNPPSFNPEFMEDYVPPEPSAPPMDEQPPAVDAFAPSAPPMEQGEVVANNAMTPKPVPQKARSRREEIEQERQSLRQQLAMTYIYLGEVEEEQTFLMTDIQSARQLSLSANQVFASILRLQGHFSGIQQEVKQPRFSNTNYMYLNSQMYKMNDLLSQFGQFSSRVDKTIEQAKQLFGAQVTVTKRNIL